MRRLILALSPPALALALALLPLPAPAQDAPPHVDEAPRPAAKPPATPVSAKPVPGKPTPAKPGQAKPIPAPGPKPGPAGVKNDGKRHLRSLDENHDGRVSRKEYLARAREQFAELDLNHDGVLSARELEKAGAKARKKRDEARRRAGKPPVAAEADLRRAPFLSGRDQNADGRVTLKEFLAGREKKFAELDANHDGIISREEARSEKGRLLARRAELKAEQEEVALRQAERRAVRAEKQAVRERRAARHEELVAEREARLERRVERMARRAEGEWELSPEAAELAPHSDTPAAR